VCVVRLRNDRSRNGGLMFSFVLVFIGAGVGGIARYATGLLTARAFGPGFPYGTITVNILGSFLMGLLTGIFAAKVGHWQLWKLMLTTGILGGFTTFSSFSLDAVVLYERGDVATAIGYVAASIAISFTALVAGLMLTRLWGQILV
jgi:fluoride exporter